MTALILVPLGMVLCILLSAFCSASEMAYSSANQIRLRTLSESGDRKAGRALRICENFEEALSSILICNNLANIACSSLCTVLIILLTGDSGLCWLGSAVVTLLVIIFGETVPKITARKAATKAAVCFSGVTWFMMLILKPFVALIVRLIRLLTDRIRTEEDEADPEESVQELQSMIDTAQEEGIFDDDSQELIKAAIDFSDISASEVMTARVDVEAVDIEDPVEEVLEKLSRTGYTRIPVYQDSIDNIIGVLHINHFLKALSENDKPDIRRLLLPPCYVYRTMRLPEVLRRMREMKQHLAIVTDEYSGTYGIISMEDVMEQIVGEIWDEKDTIEEDVVKIKENILEIDGDMPISEFIEICGLDALSFEFESETAGGWVIEYLGDFPKQGDSFRYKHISVTVTMAENRRVSKLKVVLDGTV